MRPFELARTVRDAGDGKRGGIVGFDLYPRTGAQAGALRRAILQWEVIRDLAGRIERGASDEAGGRAEAPGGHKAVYAAKVVRRREALRGEGRA